MAALHPKHSPLATTGSMRLAARGADILSSGPPRRSHMLCLWRALQTPPVGDGPVQRRPVQHISPTERAGDAVDGRRDRLSMCVPCLAPGATRAGRVYLDRRLRRHGRTQRQEASDALTELRNLRNHNCLASTVQGCATVEVCCAFRGAVRCAPDPVPRTPLGSRSSFAAAPKNRGTSE